MSVQCVYPQTISAIRKGNVQFTVAEAVIVSPAPLTFASGINIARRQSQEKDQNQKPMLIFQFVATLTYCVRQQCSVRRQTGRRGSIVERCSRT